MQKQLALCLGTLLLSSVALAQMASGSVSESSSPQSEVIDAQNFRVQRTLEGCVIRQGSDYLLVPKHGRPLQLSSIGGENLGPNIGRQVKVHGRETYALEGANPEADYAVAAEQIEVVAQSCPVNWNEKWVRHSGVRP